MESMLYYLQIKQSYIRNLETIFAKNGKILILGGRIDIVLRCVFGLSDRY